MNCTYVTKTGGTCSTKKLVNGTTYCATHFKSKRVQNEIGKPSPSVSSTNPVPIAGGNPRHSPDPLRATSSLPLPSDSANLGFAYGLPENCPPIVRASDIRITEQKPEKALSEANPVPAAVPKRSKFIDDLLADVEVVSVSSSDDDEDIEKKFDDLDSLPDLSYDEQPSDKQASKQKIASNPKQGKCNGGKRSEPLCGSHHQCGLPPANNSFAQKMVKLGYFNMLCLAETISNPHLSGLVHDCQQDRTIDECLVELSNEYDEMLGLTDIDPHWKLVLCTGMIMSNCYTMNKLKSQGKKVGLQQKPATVSHSALTRLAEGGPAIGTGFDELTEEYPISLPPYLDEL